MLGVYIPTYKSPVRLRAVVTQMLLQSRKPDVIAVHQNGEERDYRWCIADMHALGVPIHYTFTPGIRSKASEPFLPPLESLVSLGCTKFAKIDDDDLFYTNHLQKLEDGLEDADIVLRRYCDVLELDKTTGMCLAKNADWSTINPTGSMSDASMFTLRFATMFITALKSTGFSKFADDEIMRLTMDRAGVKVNRMQDTDSSCVYVSHTNNMSGCILGNIHYTKQRDGLERV
jgi:hypothetical protein